MFVYKLIARGTVEEKIQHLQKEKSDLAAGVLDGRQAGTGSCRAMILKRCLRRCQTNWRSAETCGD